MTPRWLSVSLAEISPVADALTASMVYYPGGWEDGIPREMLKRVVEQRLELVKAGIWDRATDAEIACYLSCASLCLPFSHDMTEIFIYEVWKTLPELNWKEVLHVPEELTQSQQYELDHLKFKIRNSQIKHRGENIVRKIVIEEHDAGKIMVGITKDKCDPVIETVDSLEVAFGTLPILVAAAEKKWADAPLNPKFEAPKGAKPAAPAMAPAPATPAKTSGRRKKGEQAVQGMLGAQPAKEEPKPVTTPDGGAQAAPSSAPVPGAKIPVSEAIKIAEAQGGSRTEIEAGAPIAKPLPLLSEEKPATAEEKIAELSKVLDNSDGSVTEAVKLPAAAPSVSASEAFTGMQYKGYWIKADKGNDTWYVEKEGMPLSVDHSSIEIAKQAIDQREADRKPAPKVETATEELGAKLGAGPGDPVPETTVEAAAASGQNSENAGAVPGKKPRAPRAVKSDTEYFLADGKGPFATVQLALDALGVPVGEGRPDHNRYDRLGKEWKAKIIEKPKAAAVAGLAPETTSQAPDVQP